jgi:hypothetical protein
VAQGAIWLAERHAAAHFSLGSDLRLPSGLPPGGKYPQLLPGLLQRENGQSVPIPEVRVCYIRSKPMPPPAGPRCRPGGRRAA